MRKPGQKFYSVSDAARLIAAGLRREVSPRQITRLFYERALPDDQAQIVAGRRMIPGELLPQIANELRRRGWLGRPM